MRCFSCHSWSLKSICQKCQTRLFAPAIRRRKVGTLEVISFYPYSAIESLLLHKHKPEGHRIYRDLAHITLKPFIRKYTESDPSQVSIIGVDERVKKGYSHVACMTHTMRTPYSKPLHSALLSSNHITYAGKTLQYRLDNPRDFRYSGPEGIDAILVDDIVTTGITLQEAQNKLREHGVNVLFALTLADARE